MVVPKCPKCGSTTFSFADRSHGNREYTMVCCSACGSVVGIYR